MSGWSCKYEVNAICLKVDGALCRPGMKGCILQGQVTFHDGVVPTPEWPAGHNLARQYVSLATQTRTPSLDLKALFSGTDGL